MRPSRHWQEGRSLMGQISHQTAHIRSTRHYGWPLTTALLALGLAFAATASGQESRQVKLTLTVVDANKQPVVGGIVTITRDQWGPEMRPYDIRVETDGNGIATAQLALGDVPWTEGRLFWPVVDIEVTKGSKTATDRVKITGNRLSSGVRYPAEITRTITMRGSEVNVAVLVMGDDAKPVEGAAVLIADSGAGGMGGARYRGSTGSDGKVTIPVLLWEQRHTIQASKEGYDSGQTPIMLNEKQLGRTVDATVTLKKGAVTEATEVTITVTKESTSLPAADVAITFTPTTGNTSGLYRATTNSAGEAKVRIPGYGTFDVALTQETFEPLRTQVQLGYAEGEKSLRFTMKEKPTGEEAVTVIVLAGDRKDGRGGYQPVKGAIVKVGNASMATDGSGTVTLNAKSGILETSQGEGYVEAVDVKVSADGYKSQSRSVPIRRRGGSQGTGAGTFVLEAGEDPVSDETPITLFAEVRDAKGPLDGAKVTFYALDGTDLYGGATGKDGRKEFSSYHSPDRDLASLRKGLKVKVTKTGYNEHQSSIPADLLKPAKESKYSVQLDQDWSDLAKAIAGIEGQVGALRNEIRSGVTKGQSVKLLAAKSIAARGRVEAWLNELKAARKAFDTKLSGTKCEEAKELATSIETLQKEAAEKEKAFTKLLQEATGLAASCKTKAEGAVVADKHRNAIKLIGEIGGAGTRANVANGKLTRFTEVMKDSDALQIKLQETATNIDSEVATAKKDANTAMSDFNDAFSADLNLPGKRSALLSEYGKLKATFKLTKDYDHLPKDLAKRLESLDATLGEGGNDLSLQFSAKPDLSRVDEVIKPNLAQLEQFKSEADGIVSSFKQVLCDVKPLDQAIEEIRNRVTNAGLELGFVADLPSKAAACGAAASPSPTATPTPSPSASPTATPSPSPSPTASPSPADEMVTVPSVSGAESIDYARTILNQAGFKSGFSAVKPDPTKDKELSISHTTPGAGEKAKKGSLVTVFIFQKYEATPTPTPTATPARTTALPSLIGLTLEQAVSRLPSNMRIGSDEVGDAPPTPEQALTIFYQSPTGGALVDSTKPLSITVKRYGSAQSTLVQKFDGTYVGSYRGDDKGSVRFNVAGGAITISSPGSGSGSVSAAGSASISGAGRDGNSSYSFTGTFAVGADGKATASGSWTGTQSGYSGSGTWSAARP